ncbi:hypothetical protein [Arthrobacter sp. SD76]|uniref:hypothetical protein n=1 Tax=Arthrobacter sp. SD76 TaxID=3415007 RepID=UPI003C73D8CF
MGAVAGKDTGYPLIKWSSLLVTPATSGVDLMIIAHGHNKKQHCTQHGHRRGHGPETPRPLRRQRVCAAFYADGRTIANTLVTADGLHPSNAGAVVWLYAMMKPLFLKNTAARPLSPALPAFLETRRNFLTNPNDVTATPESDIATFKETKAFSAQLVKTTAGSTAKLVQNITAQAKLMAGKDVTFAVRMYSPTGTPQTATQISLNDGPQLIISDQWKPINDVWFWKIMRIRCRAAMTVLTCNIQLDSSGTGSNETIYADRASLAIGKYPADSF